MSQYIRNSIWKTSLACAATFGLLTTVASADLQTKTFSIDGSLQDASPSGQFTLPDFDSTWGTLEGVNITLTINSTAKIQIVNTSGAAIDFTDASLTLPASISGPGGLNLSTSLSALLDSGTAQPGLNSYASVGSTNSASQQLGGSSFDLWQNQAGDVVTFSYVKGNKTSKGTDLGDQLYFGGNVTGTGSVTVQYSYLASEVVATPEPSGKYLSGLVAGAMVLLYLGRKNFLRA